MSNKYVYLILHIPTGEVFCSGHEPLSFIEKDECIEEYEILDLYDLGTAFDGLLIKPSNFLYLFKGKLNEN